MSIESMALVLHHSRATGTAKLVLLGIANHDGDGGAWPSLDTLAVYGAVNHRNTQKALRQLEDLGELVTDVQQGGTGTGPWWSRPNRYQLLVECPAHCDRRSNHRCRLGCGQPASTCSHARPGVGSDTRGVSESAPGGVSVATPEPSVEPSLEPGDGSPK